MKRSIQLRTLGHYGEKQFVDFSNWGPLSPDWFPIYTVGRSSNPIPEFDDRFVAHFLDRATELGIRDWFI